MIKFGKSFSKILFPILFRFFSFLKINRRAINYLSEKSFFSNNNHDFKNLIKSLLKEKKIIALDVGAQGGFNSDHFLSDKYNIFFDPILIEPIKEEAEKLKIKNKNVIANALWSSRERKIINILGNRLGSSSMYEPDPNLFDLHKIKKKDYDDYKITSKVEVQCETLSDSLKNLNIKTLDYLKIDTQGAELEILKGIGNYQPLIIKIESHVHTMYKNVPSWNELLEFLYRQNYVLVDWKGIGSHATRVPAEMDMIFIPNFNSDLGKKIISQNEEKFTSLMLIFGQISLLKIISKKNRFKFSNRIESLTDFYFN
ncbi:FkbM family methyltransferase [Pelagibacteraceae bacterium]|nr:FkbM family methyltransferase [Pelagibacteraceae bacterium]